MSAKIKDITGMKFGRLTAINVAGATKMGTAIWMTTCECGNKKAIIGSHLRNGNTKSCGCLASEVTQKTLKDRNTTHGLSHSLEYRIWLGIIKRCYNKLTASYGDYGGRGIIVCDRWLGKNGFINFYADMGLRPSKGHSIDRIDNGRSYSPENCRWATPREQALNTRRNVYIEHDGIRLTIDEWSKKTKISYNCIRARLKRGLTSKEIFQRVKERDDG